MDLWDEALRYFERAVQDGNLDAYQSACVNAVHSRRSREAKAWLKPAVTTGRTNHLFESYAAVPDEDWSDADAFFREAVASGLAEARAAWAWTLEVSGRTEEALAVLELVPEDTANAVLLYARLLPDDRLSGAVARLRSLPLSERELPALVVVNRLIHAVRHWASRRCRHPASAPPWSPPPENPPNNGPASPAAPVGWCRRRLCVRRRVAP
ncbi:hypothetical protein OG520_02570 [Streptomyces sp. NBC_00984]|uniref:hypothetical protein n=1 Tax=Streptomyces sp. NBC_00984 TaxID=2903700 RepID=UPI00386D4878|nr:hypothetical protein OG520_02570 [Streptomyces sp. NBC_00984]